MTVIDQKTFKLTKPYMTGDHVAAFQRAMTKKHFYTGKVDGICGELTVQGFYRAKYWLGYRTPDHSAADLLYSYLTNTKKPSDAMKQRTQVRLKAAKAGTTMREKALVEARRHIGEKERTGKNDISYSDWWGAHGPWCAMFVSWCYIKAGSTIFHRGQDHGYAYVPFFVQDAKAGRNNLTVTRNPLPGDVPCYDWEHDGVPDHMELFEGWINRANGTFATVGGNTSGDDSGSQSNGGMVCHRKLHPRFVRDVQVFVHVGK